MLSKARANEQSLGRSEGICFPGPGAGTTVWERGHKYLSPLLVEARFTDFLIFSPYQSEHLFLWCSVLSIRTHSLHTLSHSHSVGGISPLVLWRSHLHMEHRDQRSPTQHHYLLQLHKCWFPTTATSQNLLTPMCTRNSRTKHLHEKELTAPAVCKILVR